MSLRVICLCSNVQVAVHRFLSFGMPSTIHNAHRASGMHPRHAVERIRIVLCGKGFEKRKQLNEEIEEHTVRMCSLSISIRYHLTACSPSIHSYL